MNLSNNDPSVLIIMPVYNAQNYLDCAINSVLNQSFESFQVLAVDDGSTDNSLQILKNSVNPKLIVKSQENAGLVSVINDGIDYATTHHIPFIARMDADDISMINRLKKQWTFLIEHPSIAACSCNCEYINTQGFVIGTSTVPISNRLIRWELDHGLRGLVHGALMARTESLVKVGGYRNEFVQAEDTDLFFRLLEKYSLANLPDYLYQIRLHNDSRSVNQAKLSSQYNYYSKDCHRRRIMGKIELSFEDYLNQLSGFEKLAIARENLVLRLWRMDMQRNKGGMKVLAGLLEPKRVLARLLRQIERNFPDLL